MKRLIAVFVLVLASTAASAQTQPNCTINPNACQAAPVPSDCPAGQHWTVQGSGVAHCVANDPTCASGETLKHDALGNPSCAANPTTTETEYRTIGCKSGWEGQRDQERTVTKQNGVIISATSWITVYSDCSPSSTTTTTTPSTGSCANGATDYPTCTPPTTSTGTTGGTTTGGTTPTTGGTTPTTGGGTGTCANGASDYPTCTTTGSTTGSTQPPPATGTCSNGASNYPTCTYAPPAVTCSTNEYTDTPECPAGARDITTIGIWTTIVEECSDGSSRVIRKLLTGNLYCSGNGSTGSEVY